MRIGNGAYDQFQLDAYGEVINAFYDARVKGLPQYPGAADQILLTLVDFVETQLAAARRRHLGDSRRDASALHALEAAGLGRRRSRDPHVRGVRRRRRPQVREAHPALACAARGDSRQTSSTRAFNPRIGAFTQCVRIGRARRQRAPDPAHGLSARRRSAHAVHRRCHREGPDVGRARAPLLDRDGRRRPAPATRPRSSSAASGSSTTTRWPAASTTPRPCSIGWCR